MNYEPWWIWAVLATLFIIGEVFTAGFFLMWFGLGAAVAAILALLGLNSAWQWGAFVVVSGILVVSSRKLAEKFTAKQPAGIGPDRLINKTGIVVKETFGRL